MKKLNTKVLKVLKENKKENLDFLKSLINLVNDINSIKPHYKNNSHDAYFDVVRSELTAINNQKNKGFKIDENALGNTLIAIQSSIRKVDVKKISNSIYSELVKETRDKNEVIQCIFFEFDHHYNPVPFVYFYGSGNCCVEDSENCEDNNSNSKEVGMFKSKINFDGVYEPLYNIEWLENNYNLNEIFNAFLDYIMSEIFLIFFKAIEKIEQDYFIKSKVFKKPLAFCIREHDIAPFNLFQIGRD